MQDLHNYWFLVDHLRLHKFLIKRNLTGM